jgi:phage terminase Nu1 subunit (DNA packaging protein)
MESMIVNQANLSRILGCSAVSVRSFEQEGMPVVTKSGRGKSAEYDTVAVIKWLIARGGWRQQA